MHAPCPPTHSPPGLGALPASRAPSERRTWPTADHTQGTARHVPAALDTGPPGPERAWPQLPGTHQPPQEQPRSSSLPISTSSETPSEASARPPGKPCCRVPWEHAPKVARTSGRSRPGGGQAGQGASWTRCAWSVPSSSLGRLAAPSRPRSRPQANAPRWVGGVRGPPHPERTSEGESPEQRLTDTPRGPEDRTGQGCGELGCGGRKTPAAGVSSRDVFIYKGKTTSDSGFLPVAQLRGPRCPLLGLPPSPPSPTPRRPGPQPRPVLAVLGWALLRPVARIPGGWGRGRGDPAR